MLGSAAALTAAGWSVHCAEVNEADGVFFGNSPNEQIGVIKTTLTGAGVATLTYRNTHVAGTVSVFLDTAIISTAAPREQIAVEFQYTAGALVEVKEFNGWFNSFNLF